MYIYIHIRIHVHIHMISDIIYIYIHIHIYIYNYIADNSKRMASTLSNGVGAQLFLAAEAADQPHGT
jgi:hypothetical protein